MFHRFLTGLMAAVLLAGLTFTAAPTSALPAWRDTGVTWTNPDAVSPRVVGIRYARHAGFDRVVIDVRGRIPGYRTYYGRNFTYDGSGAPVPIHGAAGLSITMSPATAHSLSIPLIRRPGFPALKELALTGDYEGYVTFGFALNYRASHRVFRLHDPQRIVIDFKYQ